MENMTEEQQASLPSLPGITDRLKLDQTAMERAARQQRLAEAAAAAMAWTASTSGSCLPAQVEPARRTCRAQSVQVRLAARVLHALS